MSPEADAFQALSVFDREGDLAKAKAQLDVIQGGGEGVGKVYRLLAAHALQASDPDKQLAKECLLKAIELGDRIPQTYDLLAYVLAELSDWKGAIEYKRQVIALQPGDGDAFLSLGEFLVSNREFTEAREQFRRALSIAPGNVDIPRRMASAWGSAGQLDDAAEAYAGWLRFEPDSSMAHSNLAFVLFDLGRHADALEHWQHALRVSPDEADAMAGQAAALHVLDRHEEGRAAYVAAISLNGDFLDETVMRTKYLWSDAAIAAVRSDIAAATQTRGSHG